MNAAINILLIKLEALQNNEPIHREEGNTEQADACLSDIAEIKAALATLGHKIPREFYMYRDNNESVFQATEESPYLRWDEVIRVREILD